MGAPFSVFLSHIAEEAELATLLKGTLEREFVGFVDVFSFSDRDMNPAGREFMKIIEEQLLRSAASIFLLSPPSLKRPWTNFELGAQWMKNVIYGRDGKKESIIIPACHSGVTPANLPVPLSFLNAVASSEVAGLERIFSSVQSAVGARGSLRENFSTLAGHIQLFERHYTIGSAFLAFWSELLPENKIADSLAEIDRRTPFVNIFQINVDDVEQKHIDAARIINSYKLDNFAKFKVIEAGSKFTDVGTVNVGKVELKFTPEDYRKLRASMKSGGPA